MQPESIINFIFTPHAKFEMQRRGLSEDIVNGILKKPEQRVPMRPGRVVFQSRVKMEEHGNLYLIRVFVDIDRVPNEVVTVYKTSKISKYWEEDL